MKNVITKKYHCKSLRFPFVAPIFKIELHVEYEFCNMYDQLIEKNY